MFVMSMAPKRKSALSQNPLRSRTSFLSSDPTPSHIQFRDEDAQKDFSENFSNICDSLVWNICHYFI